MHCTTHVLLYHSEKKCKFCQGLSFTHRQAIGLRYSQLHLLVLVLLVTVRPDFYLPACLSGFCHFLLNISPHLNISNFLWTYTGFIFPTRLS